MKHETALNLQIVIRLSMPEAFCPYHLFAGKYFCMLPYLHIFPSVMWDFSSVLLKTLCQHHAPILQLYHHGSGDYKVKFSVVHTRSEGYTCVKGGTKVCLV
jgi:hypothetical protein